MYIHTYCFIHSLCVCVCVSFGSGFDMESTDPDYIEAIAEQVTFAKLYNIEVGG